MSGSRSVATVGWRAVALPMLLVAVCGQGHAEPVDAWWQQWLSVEQAAEDWAGSDRCRTCHRDHYRTWHRTFHRTMTQEATPDTVAGPFDGRELDYWGQLVRLEREGDTFWFEYLDRDTGQPYRRLPVERTVGSHRYQQYLTRHPDAGPGNYWRLPLLWHLQEQRWIHVNGVFLGSDDQDFDNHLTMWNQNCIFCHNTGPVPNIRNLPELLEKGARGEAVDFRYEPRYRSWVAELGIACEMCHSPGEQHVQLNRNPLRRYLLHLTDAADPTIVNPARLDQERATAVCGQCHAQRLPREPGLIRDWLQTGPTFRAGDRLTDHVEPIRIDTPAADARTPDQFRLRFWPDGTPRLSAYEYQGLTMSACYQRSDLTCITCHTAHGGDPAGMIPPRNRGNEPCQGCHQDLEAGPRAHTRHAADSEGSVCYNCHMPHRAYGVMTLHRSHRIEVPDPAAAARAERPDACTNCHVDRSSAWASQAMAALWGQGGPVRDDPAMPRLVEDLLTGDPVQRAVAAWVAGRFQDGAAVESRVMLVPFLLMTLEDRYPMLRWLARKSLLAIGERAPATLGWLAALGEWDYIAGGADRAPMVQGLWERWEALDKQGYRAAGALPLDDNLMPRPAVVEEMLSRRSNREIEIGE